MGRKKPGPKARRRNPRPLADEQTEIRLSDGRWEWVRLPLTDETAWITAEQVDAAEHALRQDFKARRRELTRRTDETMESATRRICRLVEDVAEENAVDLWWTGQRREHINAVPVDQLYPLTHEPDRTWTCRYVGPDSPTGARRGDEWHYRITARVQQRKDAAGAWVPMDAPARVIERYDAAERSWTSLIVVPEGADAEQWLKSMVRPIPWTLKSSWPGLVQTLSAPIAQMVRGEMGRAGKEGRPAFLAYVTLGALLDLSPLHVRTLLDNFRRPRHRRKT